MSGYVIHKDMSRWCQMLSRVSHRACHWFDCACECHNLYSAKNYEGNKYEKLDKLRKVKRI